MKCFIHKNVDAVRVCVGCGKGMCLNCSSFNHHGPFCPDCKKKELKKSAKNHFVKSIKYSIYEVLPYIPAYIYSQFLVNLVPISEEQKNTIIIVLFAIMGIFEILRTVHFIMMIVDLVSLAKINKSNKQGIKRI